MSSGLGLKKKTKKSPTTCSYWYEIQLSLSFSQGSFIIFIFLFNIGSKKGKITLGCFSVCLIRKVHEIYGETTDCRLSVPKPW